MREIVVGFSDTDESRDALALAELLASAGEARLAVAAVYVIDPLLMRVGEEPGARNAFFGRTFEQAAEQVEAHRFEQVAVTGTSAQEGLHRTAEQRDADLLVVGSSHRGKLGRVLAGSVGESLLSAAPCAVAVAPRGFAQEHPERPRAIGAAWDGRSESRPALHEAARIAADCEAMLHVFAVVHTWVDFGGETHVGEDLRAKYEAVLDAAADELSASTRFTPELLEGPTAPELARRAKDLDLLVVGSRGYGPVRRAMIGSTSRELFRGAPCPLMVVPRPAETESESATPRAAANESPSVAGAREGAAGA